MRYTRFQLHTFDFLIKEDLNRKNKKPPNAAFIVDFNVLL